MMPFNMKHYYVYITSDKYRGTIYVVMTNNLQRRMIEYKKGISSGFTKKYNLKKVSVR